MTTKSTNVWISIFNVNFTVVLTIEHRKDEEVKVGELNYVNVTALTLGFNDLCDFGLVFLLLWW